MSRNFGNAPRIPGGLGDKRFTRKLDETNQPWREAGDFPDPSTVETDGDNVVDLEQDPDLRASLEMAESDHENFKTNDELDPDHDPNPGHTEYDELVARAKSDSTFGAPKENPAIDGLGNHIQDKFDRAKVVERAQYLDGHAELQENKDANRNGLRWFMMLGRGKRNDQKTKKRGHAG